jgi:beta-lactamase regulating signal transducer with metallopeptidase domain
VGHAELWLPLLVAALFGAAAPRLVPLLPPREATWLLSLGGSVAALSAAAVPFALAALLLAQAPPVAHAGDWSAAALRAHAPVDREVQSVALALALAAAGLVLYAGVRRALAVRSAYRSCRELPPGTGDLVVVPSAPAVAWAVPGRPGRIVVARLLLDEFSPPERRAVLAHERSHLRHGHHWHLAAVALAAAVNPLLAGLRGAAAQAVERWADEDAAAELGDRGAVATALGRAARLGAAPAPGLAATAGAIPLRVAALLAPAPRSRPLALALVALALLAGAAAALLFDARVEDLFDLAARAHLHAALR